MEGCLIEAQALARSEKEALLLIFAEGWTGVFPNQIRSAVEAQASLKTLLNKFETFASEA